jgi:cytochrome bd ubiquinol oxidase subunit I
MLPITSESLLTDLSRWTFGLSASFHFLFVPLSIGLLLCVNMLQTADALRPHPWLARAATFWSRFFLLVWATGIVTGYPLRSRLADAWGAYLAEAQPVFKAVFEIEGAILWPMVGLVLSVTVFRHWLSSPTLALLGWMLLGVMTVQSLTILSINAWMQVPAMLPYLKGSWHVPSLLALLLHPTTLEKTWHTLSAALLCGAFFVFALSAVLMRHGRARGVATVSLGAAAWLGLLAAGSVLLSGHHSASGVAETQPMKFAAFEGHWRAEHGAAPLVIWGVPDQKRERNEDELRIPYLMSLLRDGSLNNPPGMVDLSERLAQARLDGSDAQLVSSARGLSEMASVLARRMGPQWQNMSPAEQAAALGEAARPPVKPVFFAFRLMVASGVLAGLLCIWAFVQRRRLREGRSPWLLRSLLWASPLPWIGTLSGWFVAEVGRQPWAIYGHLPTASAHALASHANSLSGLLLAFAGGLIITLGFLLCARSIWRTEPGGVHWIDVQHALSLTADALQRIHVRLQRPRSVG